MLNEKISNIKKKVNNSNVSVRESNGEIKIAIEPFDREMTLEYACFLLGAVMTVVKDFFVISIDGFNIDGLGESNSGLVRNGSTVYCNYTNQSQTLEF